MIGLDIGYQIYFKIFTCFNNSKRRVNIHAKNK